MQDPLVILKCTRGQGQVFFNGVYVYRTNTRHMATQKLV